MASSTLFAFIIGTIMICCASAAGTGKAITAADIPATPAATSCKANLDAAHTQFLAGGIKAVTQVAGATTSNYIFCMDYTPAAKDTAMIELHIEPTYVGTPLSTLATTAPQTPAFADAVYAVGAATKADGDLGLATYPWDLANKANAAPATVKTSLVERFQSATATYLCGCGVATAPASRRMLK